MLALKSIAQFNNFVRERKLDRWIILFLVVLFLAWNFINFKYSLTASDTNTYLKEADYVLQGNWQAVGDPPLIAIILAAIKTLNLPLAAFIVLNILFGGASLVLLYALTKKWFSSFAAAAASWLFCFSPLINLYTHLVLTDILTVFFFLLILFVLFSDLGAVKKGIFLGFLLMIAIFTKHLMLFFLPALLVFLLVRRQYKVLFWFLLTLLAAGLAGFLLFNKNFLVIWDRSWHTFLKIGAITFSQKRWLDLARFIQGTPSYVGAITFFLSIFGLIISYKEKVKNNLIFYFCAVCLFLFLFYYGEFQDRFILYLIPLLFMFAGYGLEKGLSSKINFWIMIVVVDILLLFNYFQYAVNDYYGLDRGSFFGVAGIFFYFWLLMKIRTGKIKWLIEAEQRVCYLILLVGGVLVLLGYVGFLEIEQTQFSLTNPTGAFQYIFVQKAL